MPEFTPLRQELETLAARAPMPDFAELRHRVARRRRRRRAIGVAVLAALVSGFTLASGLYDIEGMEPAERPSPALAPNGWIAVDVSQGGRGDIYLTRPGADPRQLEVAGSDSSDDSCPVWSPDGTRLMFGRVPGSSGSGDAGDRHGRPGGCRRAPHRDRARRLPDVQ